MNALKFTISGSYRTADGEIIDFDNISGVVPYQDEEVATMHVRRRMAIIWLSEDTRFVKRIHAIRECYIDNIEEVEHEFSFLKKDIKQMSKIELQHLSILKDLREVPLFRASEREMRVNAYLEYYKEFVANTPQEKKFGPTHKAVVAGNTIVVKYGDVGFNFAKLPELVVSDGSPSIAKQPPGVEEILEEEERAIRIQHLPSNNDMLLDQPAVKKRGRPPQRV